MLEYKITFAEMVIYTLKDPLLFIITAIVYLVLGMYFLREKGKRTRAIILVFLIVLLILYVSPTLVKALLGWEWYGYELCDHELHIKAWPVDEVVHLDRTTQQSS